MYRPKKISPLRNIVKAIQLLIIKNNFVVAKRYICLCCEQKEGSKSTDYTKVTIGFLTIFFSFIIFY